MKFCAVLLMCIATALSLPGTVLADPTRAIIDGAERELRPYELNGCSQYKIEIRAYAGNWLKTESEISTLSGLSGNMLLGRTGDRRELNAFMLFDNSSARAGQDYSQYAKSTYGDDNIPDLLQVYAPLLPRLDKISFADMDFYMYFDGADRIQLTVYRQDVPPLVLDRLQPGAPVAHRSYSDWELLGSLNATLSPVRGPIYIDKAKGMSRLVDAAGNTLSAPFAEYAGETR